MTIWPGRTQLSIVIGFAAAPMRGNRILRSAVPVGRRVPYSVVLVGWHVPYSTAAPVGKQRVPYSVAAPVGAAVPPQTKKRHPNWVPLC